MKKLLFLLCILSLVSTQSYCQGPAGKQKKAASAPTVVDSLNGNPVFVNPNRWPQLKGKSGAHVKFINENFNYPEAAKGAAGEVLISFIVTAPDGIIADLNIVQSLDSALDAEALRLVKLINDKFGWKPGKIGKSKVNTRIIYPVEFVKPKNFLNPLLASTAASTPRNLKLKNSWDSKMDRVQSLEKIEIYPQPKEGLENMYEFLYERINYPSDAINAGRQGVANISVLVKSDGTTKIVALDDDIWPSLAREAARVLKIYGEEVGWLPGKNNGKKLDVLIIVPVRFSLANMYTHADKPRQLSAQPTDTVQRKDSVEVMEIFDIVEEQAEPVGGMEAFYKLISQNIKYPLEAQRLGISGTAYVRFVIDENGKVISAETLEGYEQGFGFDEEAIRVIKLTQWVPAKQRGRAVKQRKIIPLKFRISK